MTITVKYFARLEITDQYNNVRTIQPNEGSGAQISDADEASEFSVELQNETVQVWAATGPWSDFRKMWIVADGACELELTCNDGASEQLFVLNLKANEPLYLGDDTSKHTAVGGDLFAGTADVIGLIRAKESNNVKVNLQVILVR